MSKRNWIVFSLVLIVSLFYGIDPQLYAAETKKHTFIPRCETVDDETEKKIESILEILQAEDYGKLTDRVNELLASTELLEEEKNILEVAFCLEEVAEDSHLTGKVNSYLSLLVYGIQKKEEEDIQFEEVIFIPDEKMMHLQIEGTLQDKDEKVFIDHYYSQNAGSTYRNLELHFMEERLKELERNSSLLLTITSGLASSAQAVLQNPIEKFMAIVDSIFTEKAEDEQELFEEESAIHASLFNMRFALIREEISNWEQMNMVEYYPGNATYFMIERANQVHEELPDYWYPKEEIEQGDWNGIVTYYEKYRDAMAEYDYELYEYIISDGFHNSSNFEELIERVKDEHQEE